MRAASAVTSGPMPSPATIRTFSFIFALLSNSVFELSSLRAAKDLFLAGFADGLCRDQIFVALVVRDKVDQVLVVDRLLSVCQLGECTVGRIHVRRREVVVAELV